MKVFLVLCYTVNMIEKDKFKSYRSLLQIWEHKCVLCGEGFDDLESVTREHLIPKSIMLKVLHRKNTTEANSAPSHFNCNQLRATLSLVETMKILNERKERMGLEQFTRWANKKVPNRWKSSATTPKALSKSQKRKLKKKLKKDGWEPLTREDIIESCTIH